MVGVQNKTHFERELVLWSLFEGGDDELDRDVEEEISGSFHGLLKIALFLVFFINNQNLIFLGPYVKFIVISSDIFIKNFKNLHQYFVPDSLWC